MDTARGTLETPRSEAALATRRGASRRWQRLGVILGALVLAGCGGVPRTPYPAAEEAAAAIPNMADVRVFADASQSTFIKGMCPHLLAAADRAAEPAYLALSGGGNGGAYGAGVLNGWTASGTRPEFILVTGVSTGAMIAPFAFLGPSYDSLLRELYTSGIAESLTSPHLESMLLGSGLSGNERLRELVARYVDGPMLARIAAEYAKGRCLSVVTTDLDAQRAVVWDMGRIASYGSPAALDLFRSVLIASASVPVVFPPVFIEAEANGQTFREMHVDGGLTAPVFTLPAALLLSNVRPKRPARLDISILINDEIYPEFEVVPDSTFAIAGQSVSAVLKALTRFVIFQTYEFAQQHGLGFNLTYIGADGPHCGAAFNTACMRRLYEYGYEMARSGRSWQRRPPTPVPPVIAQR